MTPAEKRLVDAFDLAAVALERFAREQDAVAGVTLAPGAGDANRKAITTTRGEAARALAAIVFDVQARPEDAGLRAREQHFALTGTDAIPSATLRTWAAGWRALAKAP